MDVTVRVVYEQGSFRPLSPINIPDGEELEITLKGNDYWKAILGDLLAEDDMAEDALENYDDVASPIEVEWGNSPTASEIIIQERD